MSGGPFLFPNVTSLPGQGGIGSADKSSRQEQQVKGEFDKVFDKVMSRPGSSPDLSQIKTPLKFSAHASQRINERKIALDPATLLKVNNAIDKAEAKGLEDTLILTGDAALIVSVKNRTVITAIDRDSLSGNVFTNIDGAVIV